MSEFPPVPVLFRDDRLAAVSKPCGLMVHRTSISRDREFLSEILREELGRRIWTVHRLDRATSGVLLVALDRNAAADLGSQFEAGEIGKRYLAVVRGWTEDGGEIDKPLRASRNRFQDAVTRFRCLARTELPVAVPPYATARYSLLDIQPLTGRGHQIRRHLNHISHPIVGDVNHGDRRHNRLFRSRFGCHRLLLHAYAIAFRHPDDGESMQIESAPPDNFSRVVDALGWSAARLPGTDGVASDRDDSLARR